MTQPDTLHERIRAEIERRLAVAKAAGSWDWKCEQSGWDGLLWSVKPDEPEIAIHHGAVAAPSPLREHIALHDPADAIRRYEGELETLERHYPIQERDNLGPVVICAYEWGDSDGYMVRYEWCPEVKALAHRLGVSVDG